ncbi:hypothetical protein, partial [Amaricoccus sp.]|uniref:hypothetical protein n=1 Tax=Amaricoccus sp. TaxID=1872485 RepID=UPI001B54FC8F
MPAPLLMSAAIAIANEFLPDLAGALKRPGGRALAATVVDAAAAAAGVSPESDPRQIIARVKENPTALDDLRLELEQLNAEKEIYLAEISDRGSARQAEIARGGDGRMRGNLMIAAVAIGLAFCIYAAIKGMVPGANGQGPTLDAGVLALITTVAGALLKMLSDAFAYEFGSSRGSKEKTEDLIAINEANQAATARAVKTAQTQAATVAARVVQETKAAVTTGAATATAVAETLANPKPRDFVGQLVRGE